MLFKHVNILRNNKAISKSNSINLIVSRYYQGLPSLPIFNKAFEKASTDHPSTAIISENKNFCYLKLLSDVEKLKNQLTKTDLNEARVAYLFNNSYDYVVTQWAIWAAGGIAVPLSVSHPQEELEYTLKDSQAYIALAHKNFESKLEPIAKKVGIQFTVPDISNSDTPILPTKTDSYNASRGALIIYTSGTTGKPKGVVLTHGNLNAQYKALTEAWEYKDTDKILHPLPLHHVHGVINALNTLLYNGGTVEFLQKFNAEKVWQRFQDPRQDLTLFMAVPTIYSKLIQYFETVSVEDQNKYKKCFNQFRLMVSGSAALPGPILQKWKNISGHTLLERYGMSEIGMALTNPYKQINSKRLEGHVGFPFPSVQARIVRPLNEDNLPLDKRIVENSDEAGELQIKGPSVFKEYFNRPEATRDTFESDGWFKTGDTACINSETGHYKILGRTSVDIIKTGGYKVSALEIEKTYLESDFVQDIAVLGVEDQEWGEKVAAIVSLKNENTSESILKEWGKKHLAPYKVPSIYIILKPGQEIPKNAMGKINKKSLKKDFFS